MGDSDKWYKVCLSEKHYIRTSEFTVLNLR